MQIAWRRRAIGSAGNRMLRVVGTRGSRCCPMYMCWNALASVFNFFAGQNLPKQFAMPRRESCRLCGAHPLSGQHRRMGGSATAPIHCVDLFVEGPEIVEITEQEQTVGQQPQ